MSLMERLASDIAAAVKARDRARATTLRLLTAAIRNEEIAKNTSALNEDEVRAVIEREVKRRQEAVEAYEQGARAVAAAKERAEQTILESYLPPPASEEEITAVVRDVRSTLPAGTPAGKVIGAVLTRMKGRRVDGARVRAVVSRILEAEGG